MASHTVKAKEYQSESNDTIRMHLNALEQTSDTKEEFISELQEEIEKLKASNSVSQEQVDTLTAERNGLHVENRTTRDSSSWLHQANVDLHDEVMRLESADCCLRSDNVVLCSDIRSNLAVLGHRIDVVEAKIADEAATPSKFKTAFDCLRRHADELGCHCDCCDRPRCYRRRARLVSLTPIHNMREETTLNPNSSTSVRPILAVSKRTIW
jgi:Arc/MetJ-type ribon-helix-helix transcriptional regulator